MNLFNNIITVLSLRLKDLFLFNYGEKFFHRRIYTGKFPVLFFIFFNKFRTRLDSINDFYKLFSCFFHTFKNTAANSRQHSSTVSRAFFAFNDINLKIHHIGDNLFPERTFGAAAADFCPFDFYAKASGCLLYTSDAADDA